MNDWQIFDGDYEKNIYEVKDSEGKIYECWPNAGRMVALDGSGKEFFPEDKVLHRIKERI